MVATTLVICEPRAHIDEGDMDFLEEKKEGGGAYRPSRHWTRCFECMKPAKPY